MWQREHAYERIFNSPPELSKQAEICQAFHTERTRPMTNRLELAAGNTCLTPLHFPMHTPLFMVMSCSFPLKISRNWLQFSSVLAHLCHFHTILLLKKRTHRGPLLERNYRVACVLCHFLSVLIVCQQNPLTHIHTSRKKKWIILVHISIVLSLYIQGSGLLSKPAECRTAEVIYSTVYCKVRWLRDLKNSSQVFLLWEEFVIINTCYSDC